MNRLVCAVLIAVGVVSPYPPSLLGGAQTSEQPPAGSSSIRACSLLPKEEVKKHLPWVPVLDRMAIEEEPIGASGSSCNYPSVLIQVLPFSQRMIDLARQKGGLEPITGIGDEAYFRNNANRYAELYVRTGKHLLTLQANVNDKIESVKPGVLNLARAMVAKLFNSGASQRPTLAPIRVVCVRQLPADRPSCLSSGSTRRVACRRRPGPPQRADGLAA